MEGGLTFGQESVNRGMEYWVYVIKSCRDGIIYIGYSSNVKERLKKHNNGSSRFTKGHRPWRLIYKELCDSKKSAILRERFLKSGIGRQFVRERCGMV